MERKILILLIILTTLFSGLFVFRTHAYEIGTHAFLTKEITDFYNKHFPNKPISKDLVGYLIDGSRREDNVPRYFHHFYDPVNDRGLADGIYRGQKSKDWAQNEKGQKGIIYRLIPSTVASILSASQIDKIKPIFDKTNFTWQKAIDLYARGEIEQALFTLGHIIHLLEDTSVPDHTRNDAHPPFDDGGSPYENWTYRFSLENPDKDLTVRLKSKKPILLSDLNSYFDGMAEYSNNNFYSKDSVDNYEFPKPDYFKDIEGDKVGFKKDSEFEDYSLIVTSANFDWSKNRKNKKGGIDFPFIINDYWLRLSTKSVQYGAGLVNLFLQEAESAREKLALQKAQRPYLATLTDGFKSLFGNNNRSIDQVVEEAAKPKDRDGFNLIAEIPIAQPKVEQKMEQKPEPKPEPRTQATVPDPLPEIETEIVSLQLQSAAPVNNLPKPVCSFSTSQAPSRQTVIVNEAAWMGTHESPNNEWFELKNIGGNPLNISGWQILDKDEQIKIVVPAATLPAGGFYLLERNSDAAVPGTSADLIYEASGNGAPALKNSDEGLRLFDPNCNLIDEVFANPDWPAGESSTRRSMERSADLSWHTYLGNGENGILGTPRKENSLPTSAVSYGGSSGGLQSSGAQNSSSSQESAPSPVKILITEVQLNPTGNRFIELYNPNDFSVDLTDWYLQRKTQSGTSFGSLVSKTYFESKIINARSYFVISRSALEGADIVLDNLTLTESNTIQLKNSNGDVVDKVGWGEATDCEVNCAPQPLENQSIQRKFQNDTFVDINNNATDFEVQNCPSPKARERTCPAGQSNQAPSAFFDYAPKDPKVGDLITFDAASSTDPDGSIAFYQWDFGDGATTTIVQPTVVHSYSAANSYLVQLTVLDNQSASSTATSTVVSVNPAAVSSTNVNHIVISEILYNASGSDTGKEFLELYNPTSFDQSLDSWSLQLNSGNSTTTTSLTKIGSKPEDLKTIKSNGFLLIGLNSYTGTSDVKRAVSLPNSASTVYLKDNSDQIIDSISYVGAEPEGSSLERKAFQNSNCFSAQNDGEYLGNGCDTDNDQNDFELRTSPNPQNTQSLPEPRLAPAEVQNFNISYSFSNLELAFNWDTNPALLYIIADISGAVPEVLNQVTTSGATKKISEIGREYKYEIFAIDQDGLESSPTQFTVNVPSFLESISWFNDPRDPSQYLLDLKWDGYPFAPIKFKHLTSGQEAQNNWQTVIFYYNQEAPVTGDLFWIDYNGNLPYKSWGLVAPNGFKIKYPNCLGESYQTAGAALILPETIDQCSSLAGNHASYALNWGQLEDNHLLINVDNSNFAAANPIADQDYVTAAFYAYQPGYEPNNYGLRLAAIDKTKYYFQDENPDYQPPTPPDNVDFDFDDTSFLLRIIWEQATDVDTLDNLISYSVNFAGNSTSTANTFIEIPVEPAATYDFELRAKDDFGNFSDVTAESYTVPDVPLPYELTDISWGHLDGSDSVSLSLEFNAYPFMDVDAPGAMIFFLNQMPPANYSFLDDDYRNGANMGGSNNFLKFSYYPCDFNGTWINEMTVGGAIFNNADCPTNSSLAMSKLLLAKLGGGDTQFTAEVINDQEFSASDYITIGFYQKGAPDQNGVSYFTNIANHNKKIYFQP